MTTQDLERDESDLDEYGMPQSVLAEPLRSLIGEFPLRPSLLGNLIPYQLSLWQGSSSAGASSGLHHDYHDNLYVLLRGRKRFRLFPPSAAKFLRTTGVLTKVHTNGLIVYEFKNGVRTVNVRSDGVPLAFLARRKREDAEAEIVDAEDDLLCLHDDSGKARRGVAADEVRRLQGIIASCEERIDEAMRETVRYGDISDDEDDEVISIKDSDDDEVSEPAAKLPRLELASDGASIDTPREKPTTAAPPPPPPQLETNFCNVALPRGDSTEELEAFLMELGSAVAGATETTEKMDSSKIFKASEMSSAFEESKAKKTTEVGCSKLGSGDEVKLTGVDASLSSATLGCLVVHLEPGEMLYIPASWFHEVTSCDDDVTNTIANDSEVKENESKADILENESKAAISEMQVDSSDKVAEIDPLVDTTSGVDKPETGKSKTGVAAETLLEGNTTVTKNPDTGACEPESLNELTSAKPSVVAESKTTMAEDNKTRSDAIDGTSLTTKTVSAETPVVSRGHLAFNYWTFPPDSMHFASPYAGEFWPRRWKEIELLRRTMGLGAGRPPQPARVNNDTTVITLDSDEDDDDDEEEEGSSDCYTMDEGSSNLICEGSSTRTPKQRPGPPPQMTDRSNVQQQGMQQRVPLQQHNAPRQQYARAPGLNRPVMIDDSSSFCEIIDEDSSMSEGEDKEGEDRVVGSTNANVGGKTSHGSTVDDSRSKSENQNGDEKADKIDDEVCKAAAESIATDEVEGNGDLSKVKLIESELMGCDQSKTEVDEKNMNDNNKDCSKGNNGIGESTETNGQGRIKDGVEDETGSVVNQQTGKGEPTDALTGANKTNELKKVTSNSELATSENPQKGQRDETADIEKELDNILDDGDDDTGLDDAIDDGLLDDNLTAV